ncbi:MAG: methylmalonyl Co-A mutase-associated GTPase MeaB [Chitinophagales bacterium]|nr:methylmalonyl Co-A mutase-associated GTPase MeaB [Chitinophagales bacterium]
MQSLEDGILNGNIAALARMITYNESTKLEDNIIADDFIAKNQHKLNDSLVLSISGIPGVGKSSFIEVFGSYLHSLGLKIAVFSIDPSSEVTQGSILGDKTRMNELSSLDNVFIRPSPSSNRLGGLGINTHKNIELAKIAGYDIILVETVGVGQSETIVKNLCDAFILLLMPASGDELQGIKKGIMEVADFYIIHKADGELEQVAKKSRKEIETAVHMLKTDANLANCIYTFSSILKQGIDIIWNSISDFLEHKRKSGDFITTRTNQRKHWLRETYYDLFYRYHSEKMNRDIESLQGELESGKYITLAEIESKLRP